MIDPLTLAPPAWLPSSVTPAFAAFAMAGAMVPGPLTMALLALGCRVGTRKGAPFLLGATLASAAVWGLAAALARPLLDLGEAVLWSLKALGAGFVLWVAWTIATAPPAAPGALPSRGRLALGGALLTAMNPSEWLGAAAAVVLFVGPGLGLAEDAAGVALASGAVTVLGCGPWLLLGAWLGARLASPRAQAWVSRAGAALMLAAFGLAL